uniref:PA domain-containing protein n=1 Tax=Anolis carolinensis TaxID=28377 RepID=A0A803SLA2_ANOCA
MNWGRKLSAVCLLILAGVLRAVQAVPVKANVSVLYVNALKNATESERCECGLYGVHSPVASVHGPVVAPNASSLQACLWNTRFPATGSPWIALIERGNCTFTEKIQRAAAQGAEAVVIYNSIMNGNYTVPMAHPGKCF